MYQDSRFAEVGDALSWWGYLGRSEVQTRVWRNPRSKPLGKAMYEFLVFMLYLGLALVHLLKYLS